jgi:hypothetical protein
MAEIPAIPTISYELLHTITRSSLLPNNIFDNILKIINKYITNDDLIKFMREQNIPPIRNLKTDKLVVDIEKRKCTRYTFGKDIVKHFADIIEPYLQDFLSYDPLIKEIKVDPTHGDILYYDNEGFFKKHRDKVKECPFYPFYHTRMYDSKNLPIYPKNYYESYEWTMYTFIVSLDTNQKMNNGNTLVWSCNNEFKFSVNQTMMFEYYSVLSNLYEICHSFKLKKKDWLLFPSEAIHEASSLKKDEMTLKLKLDIWIRIPYSDEKLKRYKCPCTLCYPTLTYRRKLILKSLKGLNYDVMKNILDYIDFDKSVDRCLYKYFKVTNYDMLSDNICSCMSCISRAVEKNQEECSQYQQFSYMEYDYPGEEYDMCNGYE